MPIMFITNLSVSASLVLLTIVACIGATPLSSDISSPLHGQLLATRGLNAMLTGRRPNDPLQKRRLHMRRANPEQMQRDIQRIQKDITDTDTRLTALEKKALPNLTSAQSTALNADIEKIILINQKSNERCGKIAKAFPNNADVTAAIKTMNEQSQKFGAALAQSKRPVGASATDLPANLKIVRDLLSPITDARNVLIKIAQGAQ
ncbi:hypothetical protein PSTT_11123 [Puccinia striiformis]|uniref:Uncharacterized protein n=1 Tax=Puccinia striiformis TaxID=27350 RepID=A0A2S4V1M9_9BASI|nr:hypothetical protein PSTT_11123 [Puccinia striiformis]